MFNVSLCRIVKLSHIHKSYTVVHRAMTVVKNEEKNAKQCYFLGSATVIYYVHVGCMPGSTIWCSTRVFDVHARSGSTMYAR